MTWIKKSTTERIAGIVTIIVIIGVIIAIAIALGGCASVKIITPKIEKCDNCTVEQDLAKRTWEVKGTPSEVTFEKTVGEDTVKITVKDEGGFDPVGWITEMLGNIGGLFDKPQIQLPID